MTAPPDAAPTARVAPAATVLLLRESDGGALQVLMTKRAARLAFMGGLWVFPGGRMEAADQSPDATARVATRDVESVRARMLDAANAPIEAAAALGLHVAACRETFEEAGVLLARPRTGNATLAHAQLARATAQRSATASAEDFLRLLAADDLLLEVDRLVYWAHWITPSFEPRRFDTRFFAVRVPAGQQASADLSELTHHAWVDEAEVRVGLREREMRMAPPTIATLEDLWRSHARHGGLDAMLAAERSRAVPPILPKIVPEHDCAQVLLPWDPGYGDAPGDGCVAWPEYPAHLTGLPSRRLLER